MRRPRPRPPAFLHFLLLLALLALRANLAAAWPPPAPPASRPVVLVAINPGWANYRVQMSRLRRLLPPGASYYVASSDDKTVLRGDCDCAAGGRAYPGDSLSETTSVAYLRGHIESFAWRGPFAANLALLQLHAVRDWECTCLDPFDDPPISL